MKLLKCILFLYFTLSSCHCSCWSRWSRWCLFCWCPFPVENNNEPQTDSNKITTSKPFNLNYSITCENENLYWLGQQCRCNSKIITLGLTSNGNHSVDECSKLTLEFGCSNSVDKIFVEIDRNSSHTNISINNSGSKDHLHLLTDNTNMTVEVNGFKTLTVEPFGNFTTNIISEDLEELDLHDTTVPVFRMAGVLKAQSLQKINLQNTSLKEITFISNYTNITMANLKTLNLLNNSIEVFRIMENFLPKLEKIYMNTNVSEDVHREIARYYTNQIRWDGEVGEAELGVMYFTGVIVICVICHSLAAFVLYRWYQQEKETSDNNSDYE